MWSSSSAGDGAASGFTTLKVARTNALQSESPERARHPRAPPRRWRHGLVQVDWCAPEQVSKRRIRTEGGNEQEREKEWLKSVQEEQRKRRRRGGEEEAVSV